MNDYRDYIDYNYRGPKNHHRMPRENRAAQFASFKALSGYEDELRETRRVVDEKISLSDDKKELINNKLQEIEGNIKNKPEVKITYFVKDLKKDGGFYKTKKSNILKINIINKEIILTTKEKILIDNIIDIE